MCMHHIVFLSSLCKWKRPKWLFFVVKRYAVREAKQWRYAVRKAKIGRYAVRKAKIGRYAVRKAGGGVTHIALIYVPCSPINQSNWREVSDLSLRFIILYNLWIFVISMIL